MNNDDNFSKLEIGDVLKGISSQCTYKITSIHDDDHVNCDRLENPANFPETTNGIYTLNMMYINSHMTLIKQLKDEDITALQE